MVPVARILVGLAHQSHEQDIFDFERGGTVEQAQGQLPVSEQGVVHGEIHHQRWIGRIFLQESLTHLHRVFEGDPACPSVVHVVVGEPQVAPGEIVALAQL